MRENERRSERLHYVENQADALAVDQQARIGAMLPKRRPMLAKTTTSTTYPTSGNKFEIIFLNAAYTKAAGTETPSTVDRQNAPREWVLNLTGRLIPEDSIIEVFDIDGYWFTQWTGGDDDDLDEKFKCSSNEVDASYWDIQVNTIVSTLDDYGEDQRVSYVINNDGADEDIDLFVHNEQFRNFSTVGDMVMGWNDGLLTAWPKNWDDKFVAVNVNDQPAYLEDQYMDHSKTYDQGDLLVNSQTVNDAGDRKIRRFVVTDKYSYVEQVLTHPSGSTVPTWVPVQTQTVVTDLRLNTGYSPARLEMRKSTVTIIDKTDNGWSEAFPSTNC